MESPSIPIDDPLGFLSVCICNQMSAQIPAPAPRDTPGLTSSGSLLLDSWLYSLLFPFYSAERDAFSLISTQRTLAIQHICISGLYWKRGGKDKEEIYTTVWVDNEQQLPS